MAGKDKKKVRPEDLVSLFERMIETTATMMEVGETKDHPKLQASLDASVLAYKAARCFFLAENYARARKYTEAFALHVRCQAMMPEASKAVKANVEGGGADLLRLLAELGEQSASQQNNVHAKGLAAVDSEASSVQRQLEGVQIGDKQVDNESGAQGSGRVLMERLDSYDAGRAKSGHDLLHFPPQLQPVACKPILFDLALNELEYPDISARVKAAPAKGGGLFGWFR